ncbi:MAG: type II toxin-antitoxin system HicB family antitoxin [Thermoguttaceae bacterium]|jgi:predicted RNase H-like HicB family nuclease
MRYKVVISKNEDGYTVHCPALRGCWSQGETEEEALENIRSAIEEYLAAVEEITFGEQVREVEVVVG